MMAISPLFHRRGQWLRVVGFSTSRLGRSSLDAGKVTRWTLAPIV
jgi:hypothetical protein